MSDEGQIEKVVSQLVRSHFEIEEAIDQIVWLRDGDEQEICLIEVNCNTLPTGSVEVFYFAPSPDVPFPVRIADVTPQEWEQVQNGQIPLPLDWTLARAKVFQRSGR